VRSGNLLGRWRSRTFFAAVTLIEAAFAVVLLRAAMQFGLAGHPELALALTFKGVGFLAVAILSSNDLWPSFWPSRA
jgi:hypothetical protein